MLGRQTGARMEALREAGARAPCNAHAYMIWHAVIRDVASFLSFCYGSPTMPRGPRLDAPDTLHHVRVRGIEGRALFRDDQDGDDFVRRLGEVAVAKDLTLYAWALVPNHLHLLVRAGAPPLARALRALLTGDAGAFNRRHRRRGHLCQNRDESIGGEEEPYRVERVRYIHLNPRRAHVLPALRALDR